jgi:hypothetical protein
VGLPQDQRRALKLGVDVSATTIATVLRRGGLSPAPRRIGPTWTQFLRLQAYGLLSPGAPSEEEDTLEGLAWDPHREAPTPVSENPAATEHDEPIHDGTTRSTGQPIATVGTRPHASLTPIPPRAGTRARDGPAMAA